MHIINCFEKNDLLYIDVATYKDANLINAMYVDAIKVSSQIYFYSFTLFLLCTE